MSRKQTQMQLTTLMGSPHLPSWKCRVGGRARDRPRQATMPWGIAYEVIMKTMLALTMDVKMVVDLRKSNP